MPLGGFGTGTFDTAVFDHPITIKAGPNDTAITRFVRVRDFRVEQAMNQRASTCDFTYVKTTDRTYTPKLTHEVTVWESQSGSSVRIFKGTIVDIEERVMGRDVILYKISCKDFTHLLDRVLWAASYDSQTFKQIVDDFVSSHAPSGITGTNVSADASDFSIDFIQFDYVRPTDALAELADKIGYDFWVDFDKDLHFVAKGSDAASFGLTDTNGNYIYRSLVTRRSDKQLKNKIFIRGGERVGTAITDDKIGEGDGVQKRFRVPYRFDSTPTVKYGGTTATVGVEFIDDFTGSNDVLWSHQEKTLQFSAAIESGVGITVSGSPLIPILMSLTDPASVNAKGQYETKIIDKTIKSTDGARQRARQELDLFANSTSEATFRTLKGGLSRGEQVNIQSDIRDIDKDYVIQRVRTRARTPTSFEHTIDLDTVKTFKLVEFMRGLLRSDERALGIIRQDDQVLELVITLTDTATAAETMTINGNTLTLAEALTGTDTVMSASINDPPTWVYGPYSPTGGGDADRKRPPTYDRGAQWA